MSGVINKIGQTLHGGGGDQKKEEEKHKGEQHHHVETVQHQAGGEHKEGFFDKFKGGEQPHHVDTGVEHKPVQHQAGGEHKEGLVDKIKDKIHGGEGGGGHSG